MPPKQDKPKTCSALRKAECATRKECHWDTRCKKASAVVVKKSPAQSPAKSPVKPKTCSKLKKAECATRKECQWDTRCKKASAIVRSPVRSPVKSPVRSPVMSPENSPVKSPAKRPAGFPASVDVVIVSVSNPGRIYNRRLQSGIETGTGSDVIFIGDMHTPGTKVIRYTNKAWTAYRVAPIITALQRTLGIDAKDGVVAFAKDTGIQIKTADLEDYVQALRDADFCNMFQITRYDVFAVNDGTKNLRVAFVMVDSESG